MSENTGDRIADGLDGAAEVADIASQEELAKTGKMSVWLRLSAAIARIGAQVGSKKSGR